MIMLECSDYIRDLGNRKSAGLEAAIKPQVITKFPSIDEWIKKMWYIHCLANEFQPWASSFLIL